MTESACDAAGVPDVGRGTVVPARERDRELAEVRAERERLYAVFAQAPAAIAILEGPEFTFTVANPRYRDLVGGREVVGRPLRDALPEIVGQGFVALLEQVIATGEPHVATEAPVRLDRRGDGVLEERFADFVYQPLRDARGRIFGVMAHAVDVTAQVVGRRQAERRAEQLQRLAQALEQSNRELDQFAYVASHDLKAPLRGIANLAQWIEEDVGTAISADTVSHLRLLHGRVSRMEALIDGILAYSRAGRTRDRPERVDTGALVREAFELLAPAPGVRLELPPDMPVLEVERVPLQQVFLNLLGNAVKFTSAVRTDGVVRVGWRREDADWAFSIADNGPGVPAEYHERIWGIFQTLAARDKVEGTGIGLSIVRKIVDGRGGRVWLESVPGEGATFHFTWPATARPFHETAGSLA